MSTSEQVNLTNLSSAGGCGCKLDPSSLQKILCTLKTQERKELVIGFDTADDCAVYEYGNDDFLLFTTDFFTPLVDDPYTYGSLAAANAVSDVFAMGGTPLIANVILGYPTDKVPTTVVQDIMRGGQDVIKSTGCMIVGGHTIVNPQPIYGFSIIGRVEKKSLKPNSGAKAGDVLILTKPIGSGILSNALKLGLLNENHYNNLIKYLLEVNSCGFPLGKIEKVHAMTDVTGFGLVGHALEMAEGAHLSLQLDGDKVEVFDGVKELCDAVLSPHSGAVKNFKNYAPKTEFAGQWSLDDQHIFCDPQSNGGLLIAVEPSAVDEVQQCLKSCLGRSGAVMGAFSECSEGQKPLVIRK